MSYEYMGMGVVAPVAGGVVAPVVSTTAAESVVASSFSAVSSQAQREAARASYQAQREAARASARAMSDEQIVQHLNEAIIQMYRLDQLPYSQRSDVERSALLLRHEALSSEYENRKQQRTMPPLPPTGIAELDELRQARSNDEAIDNFRRKFGIFGIALEAPIRTYANMLGIPTERQQGSAAISNALAIAGPLIGGYWAYRKTNGSVPWTAAGAAGGAVVAPMIGSVVWLALFLFAGGIPRY